MRINRKNHASVFGLLIIEVLCLPFRTFSSLWPTYLRKFFWKLTKIQNCAKNGGKKRDSKGKKIRFLHVDQLWALDADEVERTLRGHRFHQQSLPVSRWATQQNPQSLQPTVLHLRQGKLDGAENFVLNLLQSADIFPHDWSILKFKRGKKF